MKSSRLSSAQWRSSTTNERALVRHRLEEAPPRRECFAAPVAADFALGRETDEGEQMALDPAGIGVVVDELLDGDPDLRACELGESCSWIPACALTISPSAQSVIPSP